MERKILNTEPDRNGLWLVLKEGNRVYREWVSNKRIKPDGTILIFADKTIDDNIENWGLIDINLWLRGYGSVL